MQIGRLLLDNCTTKGEMFEKKDWFYKYPINVGQFSSQKHVFLKSKRQRNV